VVSIMTRMSRTTVSIPQFALYGETVISHKPEFAHIEDIRERSLRNGWVIKPHRHNHLFQVLCIVSGATEVQLDANSSWHSGSCVVTIPPGVVHGFRFKPGARGFVLSLGVGMPGLDTGKSLGQLLDYTLDKARVIGIVKDCKEFEELYLYLELVRKELASPRECQEAALFALINMIMIALARMLHQEHLVETASLTGIQLANRFRLLLEQHYKEHWKIGDYADALMVSISTLNRACHEALGNTAKQLILERLHIEAKRRLIYTQETFEQISADLGFKSAAYFSRAFKRVERVAPKTYRMNNASQSVIRQKLV